MIRINLLPHREEKRKERRKRFVAMAIVTLLIGGVIGLGVHLVFVGYLDRQEERNAFLTQEIKKLDAEIAEIQRLQDEISALLARKQVIESLQTTRAEPVYIFEDLVKQLPEGVFLKSVKMTGLQINIVGYAQSNARVSTLMRNLDGSPYLAQPKLVEVKAVVLSGRPANEFTMSVMVDRPKPPEPVQKTGPKGKEGRK